MAPDVVVVGAGVIGLAVARALARRRLAVEVLTRDRPGAGASEASAGMLEVHFPAPIPPLMAALCGPGRALYDPLAPLLAEETGIDIELDREGTLTLATTGAELENLRRQAAAIPGSRLIIDPAGWTAMEPALSPSLAGALFLPDDHCVNPRSLCRALLVSCERAGVRFRRGVTALSFAAAGGKLSAVRTDAGDVPAGAAVNAAGSWAGLIKGQPRPLPLRPVRGQILVLEPREPVRHVLHGPSVYAVPRADGTVLVGATIEEAGYDVRPTAAGINGLLAEAAAISPRLRDAVFREVRVGLRPGSPDDLPALGASGLPGLLLAAGHFRKGVLLAAVTAETVAALATGGAPAVDPGPYSVERFG